MTMSTMSTVSLNATGGRSSVAVLRAARRGSLLGPGFPPNCFRAPESSSRRAPCSLVTRAASGSAKSKKAQAYVCTECGYDANQWYGQCPGCKAWDSMKVMRCLLYTSDAADE